ncbi:hypothetical protein NC651_038402 [Populus alba x Populus x berolinensis]|nr:hypothetical protein NC651_038402 [Populus alba x Populus x berolinensis]
MFGLPWVLKVFAITPRLLSYSFSKYWDSLQS